MIDKRLKKIADDAKRDVSSQAMYAIKYAKKFASDEKEKSIIRDAALNAVNKIDQAYKENSSSDSLYGSLAYDNGKRLIDDYVKDFTDLMEKKMTKTVYITDIEYVPTGPVIINETLPDSKARLLEDRLREEIATRNDEIARRDQELAQREDDIKKQKGIIAFKDVAINFKDKTLQQNEEELTKLKKEVRRLREEIQRLTDELNRQNGEHKMLLDEKKTIELKLVRLYQQAYDILQNRLLPLANNIGQPGRQGQGGQPRQDGQSRVVSIVSDQDVIDILANMNNVIVGIKQKQDLERRSNTDINSGLRQALDQVRSQLQQALAGAQTQASNNNALREELQQLSQVQSINAQLNAQLQEAKEREALLLRQLEDAKVGDRNDREELRSQLDHTQKELKDIQDQLRESRQNGGRLQKREEKLQQMISPVLAKNEELYAAVKRLNQELDNVKAQLTQENRDLTNEINRLTAQLNSTTLQLANTTSQLTDKSSQLSNLSRQTANQIEQIAELKEQLTQREAQIKSQIDSLHDQNAQQEQKLQQLSQEYDRMKAEYQQIQQMLRQSQQQLKEKDDQQLKDKGVIQELANELTEVKAGLKQILNEIQDEEKEQKKIVDTENKLQDQLDSLQLEKRDLTSQLEQQKQVNQQLISQLEQQKQDSSGTINNLRDVNTNLQATNVGLHRDNQQLGLQINTLQTKLQDNLQKIQELEASQQELQYRLHSLQQRPLPQPEEPPRGRSLAEEEEIDDDDDDDGEEPPGLIFPKPSRSMSRGSIGSQVSQGSRGTDTTSVKTDISDYSVDHYRVQIEALEMELRRLMEENASHVGTNQALQNEFERYQQSIQGQLTVYEQGMKDIERELTQSKKTIIDLQTKLQSKDTDIRALNDLLGHSHDQIRLLENDSKSKQQDINDLRDKNKELDEKLRKTEERNKEIEAAFANVAQKMEDMEKFNDSLNRTLQSQTGSIDEEKKRHEGQLEIILMDNIRYLKSLVQLHDRYSTEKLDNRANRDDVNRDVNRDMANRDDLKEVSIGFLVPLMEERWSVYRDARTFDKIEILFGFTQKVIDKIKTLMRTENKAHIVKNLVQLALTQNTFEFSGELDSIDMLSPNELEELYQSVVFNLYQHMEETTTLLATLSRQNENYAARITRLQSSLDNMARQADESKQIIDTVNQQLDQVRGNYLGLSHGMTTSIASLQDKITKNKQRLTGEVILIKSYLAQGKLDVDERNKYTALDENLSGVIDNLEGVLLMLSSIATKFNSVILQNEQKETFTGAGESNPNIMLSQLDSFESMLNQSLEGLKNRRHRYNNRLSYDLDADTPMFSLNTVVSLIAGVIFALVAVILYMMNKFLGYNQITYKQGMSNHGSFKNEYLTDRLENFYYK